MYLQESEQYEYHLNSENSTNTGVSSVAVCNQSSGLNEIYRQKVPLIYVNEIEFRCKPHPLVYQPLNTVPW